MSLTKDVRSLFSRAVRQRGEDYLRSGAVDLVTLDGDLLEFEVTGSYGSDYDVTLERIGPTELRLECSCPHYDDGAYCKHLWAAIRLTERQRLWKGVAEEPAAGSKNSLPTAPWQKQLERAANRPPAAGRRPPARKSPQDAPDRSTTCLR